MEAKQEREARMVQSQIEDVKALCNYCSSLNRGGGPLGPLKKSLRSGPKGPLGPLGPLKKSVRSGIHARNPPEWLSTPVISCPEKPKIYGFAAPFWEVRPLTCRFHYVNPGRQSR